MAQVTSYEYKVVDVTATNAEQTINAAVTGGWQLHSIIPLRPGQPVGFVAIFEREKP